MVFLENNLYNLKMVDLYPSFPPRERHFFSIPSTSNSGAILGEVTDFAIHVISNQSPARKVFRKLDRHALVLLLEGKGFYRNEQNQVQDLIPGDILSVSPNIAHVYGPHTGNHWIEIYICFRGKISDLWKETKIFSNQGLILRSHDPRYWYFRFLNLLQKSSSDIEVLHELNRLCTEIYLSLSQSNPEEQWLMKASQLLSSPIQTSGDLQQIAKSCKKPYDLFRKKFTEYFQESPALYRRKKMIEKSKLLLLKASHSSKQIAELLGFSDEYHFSKNFKAFTGLSPRAFVRQSSIINPSFSDKKTGFIKSE